MDFCNRHLSRKALWQAFLLTFDGVRRYEGGWHLESRLMFPSYVLLESENEECLIKELRECGKTEGFGKYLARMNMEEEKFLKGLYGGGHHLKMSRGILFKGAARITEGPLKGMENRLCKIDRHKRLEHVRTVIGRDFQYVLAGLEITERVL